MDHSFTPYVCSIIPPHVLRTISASENVSPATRDAAFRALQQTSSLRAIRANVAASFTTHNASVAGIVPPHVLSRMAVSEDVARATREAAERTLAHSVRVRLERDLRIQELEGAVPPQASRYVYDAKRTEELPGELVRGEGKPATKDRAVNECYEALGATFDMYANIFSRNSINGRGMDLIGSVHYGEDFANAMWDGYQMIFGDGDGAILKIGMFTELVDVIGHELTHGVTQYTANLRYQGQSGALNESVSDCFGSMLKQYRLKQLPSESDWLIAAGIWAEEVNGIALRSMKEPGTAYDDPRVGKDPQPAHMKNFVETAEDGGGVHINSGIPNHAFYLVAMGLGGYSWEKPGRIWYQALIDPKLKSSATFKQFADITVDVALREYNEKVSVVVKKAWTEVGVYECGSVD
jgi:Zn-dependent metalloprotease